MVLYFLPYRFRHHPWICNRDYSFMLLLCNFKFFQYSTKRTYCVCIVFTKDKYRGTALSYYFLPCSLLFFGGTFVDTNERFYDEILAYFFYSLLCNILIRIANKVCSEASTNSVNNSIVTVNKRGSKFFG